MFELNVEDTFSAAHQLRGYEGPCENLHGHTWKVTVSLSGKELGELGMGVDFKEIRKKLRRHVVELDHTNLNDLKAFKEINPTSENVAKYLYDKLKPEFGGEFRLSRVTVHESESACAAYYE